MIWILFLVILAVCYVIKKYNEGKNVIPGTQQPPGPYRYPVLGNLPQLGSKRQMAPYKALAEFSNQYGHLMSIQFGMIYQVIYDGYDAVKTMLESPFWQDRYVDGWILERSFGKELGIFFGNGESWKEVRRFSIRTLRDFGLGKQNNQEALIEEELKHLIHLIDDMRLKNNGEICMKKIFSVSALNIIWRFIAGFRFSYDDAQLQILVHLMSKIVQLLAVGNDIIPAYPFLRFVLPKITKSGQDRRKFLTDIHTMFSDLLNKRRTEGKYLTEQRDFVDVFLKEMEETSHDEKRKAFFTEEQFSVLALDFFLAGTETTSSTLEYAFLYMLMYPEVQKKVQEEIDSISQTAPSMSDRPKMPYTEATLLEIQRAATVVPLFSRSCTQDHEMNGFIIPKGTMGIVSLYSSNYSKELWGDPENFRPERFLDINGNVKDSNKILPFGLGKRICAGEVLAKANLFKFFTSLLKRYSFQVSSQRGPLTTEPILGTVLSPKEYYAIITKRS